MVTYSTSQAAKKLGLGLKTLSRYIAQGKVPRPTVLSVGTATLHAWTEKEIEHVRKLLPKIANGRKTRYQKLREKQETQPRAAALQKKRRTKKKK
jgi:predicted DNA-binding transcriptional regulator AlpA